MFTPGPSDGVKFKMTWRYLGGLLAILAGASFTLGYTLVKLMGHYSVFSLALWRFQGLLMPSVIMLIYQVNWKELDIVRALDSDRKGGRWNTVLLLLLRAFFGCGGTWMMYKSLEYITASDSIVISATSPIFVTFMAHAFLKEQFGMVDIVAALLSTVGVIVVARPAVVFGLTDIYHTDFVVGTGLAIAATICRSCTFLLLRSLKSVHHTIINGFYGLFGSIESAVLALIFTKTIEVPQGAWDWFISSCFVTALFAAQVWSTLALKYEEAGLICLCRSLDIVMSFMWQLVLLQVFPDLWSIIGSCIIAAGVILASLRKYLHSLPHDDGKREKLSCILH